MRTKLHGIRYRRHLIANAAPTNGRGVAGRPVYIVDGSRTPFIRARGRPGPFTPVDLAVACGRPLLLREAFSRFFTEYYLIPVGVIFIAMVIFMPQGLLGFMRRWLNQ